MKYRIVAKTNVAGSTTYYVQKKRMCLFWVYDSMAYDMTMVRRNIEFPTEQSARDFIGGQIAATEKRKTLKVAKTEYIKYP